MRETITPSATGAAGKHARHLLAAEGYIDLELYEEANAELQALDPACFALEETLVLQLCVHAGLQQWNEAHELASSLAQQDPDNAQWAIWSASAACRLQ